MALRNLAILGLVAVAFAANPPRPSHDWLTWGGDPERSGWAKDETAISKDTAGKLELKWRLQLDNVPAEVVLSSLTAPLVVENVKTRQGLKNLVFVTGSADILYAIDADKGKVVWQKSFTTELKPKLPANWMCPNTQNATPVIDRQSGTVYALASDGRLRGLDIANGEDRFPPTPFTTPFSRSWSLNLIDGVLYTNFGRGCGGAVASFAAMDVSKPERPVNTFVVSAGRPGGAWGRGGLVLGPRGLYTQTADGPNDVAANKYGNSVLLLEPKTLKVLDYFTPWGTEFLNSKDLDLGSANPIVFSYKNWELVAAAAKESTVYLLDAKNLGGPNHDTPLFQQRYANDYFELAGKGVWGAMSTWVDPQGERWLYVPIWGPPSRYGPKFKYAYGMADTGSILGFQLGIQNDKPALIPMWMSRALAVPDPPVVANGVVFALSTGENTRQGLNMPMSERAGQVTYAILYAFDAATGKELYNSGTQIDSWAHFSGLAVASGRVYVVTRDSRVYAFGIRK